MPQCSVLFAFERMLLDVGLGAYRVTTIPLHSSNPVLVVQHKVSLVDTLTRSFVSCVNQVSVGDIIADRNQHMFLPGSGSVPIPPPIDIIFPGICAVFPLSGFDEFRIVAWGSVNCMAWTKHTRVLERIHHERSGQ